MPMPFVKIKNENENKIENTQINTTTKSMDEEKKEKIKLLAPLKKTEEKRIFKQLKKELSDPATEFIILGTLLMFGGSLSWAKGAPKTVTTAFLMEGIVMDWMSIFMMALRK